MWHWNYISHRLRTIVNFHYMKDHLYFSWLHVVGFANWWLPGRFSWLLMQKHGCRLTVVVSPGVICSVWAVFGSATATLQGCSFFGCLLFLWGRAAAFPSQGRGSTELRQAQLHRLFGIFQKNGHYSLWLIFCVIQRITFLGLSLVCLLNFLSLFECIF